MNRLGLPADLCLGRMVLPGRCSILATRLVPGLVMEQLGLIGRGRGKRDRLRRPRADRPPARSRPGLYRYPLVHPAVHLTSRDFSDIDLDGADRWSEVMGLTVHGLPMLCELPAVGRAYYAVRFNGRGLSWAFVAADRLARAQADGASVELLSLEHLD